MTDDGAKSLAGKDLGKWRPQVLKESQDSDGIPEVKVEGWVPLGVGRFERLAGFTFAAKVADMLEGSIVCYLWRSEVSGMPTSDASAYIGLKIEPIYITRWILRSSKAKKFFFLHGIWDPITHWNCLNENCLDVLRRSSTSNNIHQFSCDDGLASAVKEDGELLDHVSSILWGILKTRS